MWHRLSGLPDNVTDAGDIVEVDAGRRLSAEKALLRAAINELSVSRMPSETRGLARLAASYLIAGDVETARRYVSRARDILRRQTMQPIDLVFEGGGAKGMVFVGALEELFGGDQYTFGRLLGTSAGAITAVSLAAGLTPEMMLASLAEKDEAGQIGLRGLPGRPGAVRR